MPEIGLQQAKSQRARKAICRATIESLAEDGYSETSLKRVALVAGFSKGALQHHFPTKEDLIAATVDELLARTFKPIKKPLADVDDALAAAWTRFINTPGYLALLEILVAIRTDKPLKGRLTDDLRAWGERLDAQTLELYEAVSGDETEAVMLLNMTRSFMRGLLIQSGYGASSKDTARYVSKWLELVSPLLKLRGSEKGVE